MTTQGERIFGAQVVADAKRYLGVPYKWGGDDPKVGLDCSGFVVVVMRDLGVQGIPHLANAQKTIGARVPSLAQAIPGDLLFFGSPVATHVAIYLGGHQLIHAPVPGDVVKIGPVYTTPSVIRRYGTKPVAGPLPTDNPVTSAGKGVLDGTKALLDAGDAVGGFLGTLGQRSTWVRVLQVVGGAGLIVAGLYLVGSTVLGDVAGDVVPVAGGAIKAAVK